MTLAIQKTKSKKLTQNRSIKTAKFGQSGRIVCEKAAFLTSKQENTPHEFFQCFVITECLLK